MTGTGASASSRTFRLSSLPACAPFRRMERVANKALGFRSARLWELEQYRQMDADERRRVAKALRDRVYGTDCPDVREAVGGLRRTRQAVTQELVARHSAFHPAHATTAERANWRLVGRGEGVRWPVLDEDLSVDGLLAGRPSGESQSSLENWFQP